MEKLFRDREKSSYRIEGLDVLRFAAAFSVMLYHYFFIGPLQGAWPMSQFIAVMHFGDFGVDVFFIISGLVISISAEGRNVLEFIKSRFIRIFPAFIICSIFTAITSSLLPGVRSVDIFYKWIASFTFYPDLFGSSFLAGVYWTLQIEVKFYIFVALFIAVGLWGKQSFYSLIIPLWLLVSMLNEFYINNHILNQILLTEFAGHFVAGILLYRLKKECKDPFMPLGFLLSFILVWKHCTGIESWLGGTFNQAISEVGTLFTALTCILIVYYASGIKVVPLSSKLVSILGAMSYILYLIHADFGFFLRAIVDRWAFKKFPFLIDYISNKLVVSSALILSLIITGLIVIYLEPPLSKLFKSVLKSKRIEINHKETGL